MLAHMGDGIEAMLVVLKWACVIVVVLVGVIAAVPALRASSRQACVRHDADTVYVVRHVR